MAKRYLVIGLGRFGEAVAKALRLMQQDVMGVDSDEGRTQALADILSHVIQADATQEGVLERLSVSDFDAAVVAMGAEVEGSILVTMMLKELGCPYVVARASSEMHERVLKRVGADRVIFPERDMGARVAHGLLDPRVIDYFELMREFSVMELEAPSSMHGCTLAELGLRQQYNVNLLGIRRKGGRVVANPGGEDTILPGDILIVAGSHEALQRLSAEV